MKDKNKIIHLMVTNNCLRHCKYCCNKQYDVNSIPVITEEEYKYADTILLTGGEPVVFANPSLIACSIKAAYPNIKNVYVYANASELVAFLSQENCSIAGIDGFSVSIKDAIDLYDFNKSIGLFPEVNALKSNRLYIFDNLYPEDTANFQVIERQWQTKFIPADDSIFRRYEHMD